MSIPLDRASDTVLYDMFYESGTILNCYLMTLEDHAIASGKHKEAQSFRDESFNLLDEREATASHDRSRQITLKEKWDTRRNQLDETYPTLFE